MNDNNNSKAQINRTPGFISIESSRQSSRFDNKKEANKQVEEQPQDNSYPQPKPLRAMKNSFAPKQFHYDEKELEKIQNQKDKAKKEQQHYERKHNFQIQEQNQQRSLSDHQQRQVENRSIQRKGLLTFNPSLMHKMYQREGTVIKLQKERQKLTKQIETMSKMLSEYIQRKNDTLTEYEACAKQRKIYQRICKNLEEEYEGYQFMLTGDYIIKLEEECHENKKKLTHLRKEVSELRREMSTPIIKNQSEYKQHLDKLEKEAFELQIQIDLGIVNNGKKEQKHEKNKQNSEKKKKEIRKMELRQAEIEQILGQELDQSLYGQDGDKNIVEYYEELLIKSNRLKKINQSQFNARNHECHKKLKEIKVFEYNTHEIMVQIDTAEQRALEKRRELAKLEDSKKRKVSIHSSSKAPTSSSFSASHYDYQPRTHIKTEFTSYNPSQDDHQQDEERLELAQRNKRRYKQLQKNLYFKNIENSEFQKKSRIKSNASASLSQHKIEPKNGQNEQLAAFLKENNEKKRISLLPEISLSKNDILLQQLNKERSPSHAIPIKKKQSQRQMSSSQIKNAITTHNQQIQKLRFNKMNCLKSYQEICNRLNKDKLLIEEDCEYQMKDLIYNSRY